jgi:hypothetical protein
MSTFITTDLRTSNFTSNFSSSSQFCSFFAIFIILFHSVCRISWSAQFVLHSIKFFKNFNLIIILLCRTISNSLNAIP